MIQLGDKEFLGTFKYPKTDPNDNIRTVDSTVEDGPYLLRAGTHIQGMQNFKTLAGRALCKAFQALVAFAALSPV